MHLCYLLLPETVTPKNNEMHDAEIPSASGVSGQGNSICSHQQPTSLEFLTGVSLTTMRRREQSKEAAKEMTPHSQSCQRHDTRKRKTGEAVQHEDNNSI